MILLVRSPQTGRPIAYIFPTSSLSLLRGKDEPQVVVRRYGYFVAAKQADGSWLDRYGDPYEGGADLDACPWADDVKVGEAPR